MRREARIVISRPGPPHPHCATHKAADSHPWGVPRSLPTAAVASICASHGAKPVSFVRSLRIWDRVLPPRVNDDPMVL
eukprot:4376314-Prymnesium_polylepis.1